LTEASPFEGASPLPTARIDIIKARQAAHP
jgi:hypothetical protein